MNIIRLALLCVVLGLISASASGQPAPALPEWITDLRRGGYVIVFRHGTTTSDPANVDPMRKPNADPMSRPGTSAQRQLTEQGRAQATSIGRSMRKLNIPVGQVLTSTAQRAIDTGKLFGFGDVTPTSDLSENGPTLPPDENDGRAQALRKLAAGRPPADNNLVIVSHKPNIIAAFGEAWTDIREGEASVFEPDGHGGYKLVVRIQANEWSKFVAAPD
jgi:phosphohistidine phosphatase SixA